MEVTFIAKTKKRFDGVVQGVAASGNVLVSLGTDPFPVEVGVDKLIPKEYDDTMTTKTKTPTAAAEGTTKTPARRRKAAAAPAPAPAKRTARKAAAAPVEAAAKPTKTVAKKASTSGRVHKTDPSTWPVEGKNPYRPGSNLFKITDVLLKGGKRSALVAKLQRVIDMHPYTQNVADLDVEKELDKRLMLTAGLLERNFGFTIEKSGRGMESGTVKVVPPTA